MHLNDQVRISRKHVTLQERFLQSLAEGSGKSGTPCTRVLPFRRTPLLDAGFLSTLFSEMESRFTDEGVRVEAGSTLATVFGEPDCRPVVGKLLVSSSGKTLVALAASLPSMTSAHPLSFPFVRGPICHSASRCRCSCPQLCGPHVASPIVAFGGGGGP